MPDLETVNLEAVEILSAGGPVHGVGSPPEGDFWSKDDLQSIADANRELAAELKPPNKIGHSTAQVLLENGQKLPTPGEMPAVGWLDGASFDVVERDGVAKLVADINDVPKQFAQLLETKAYRTRSVELSKVESQELVDDAGRPRVFEWVVSGLAWLGAKLPAVRTLDDIVALYEHEELGDAPAARVFVVYATGDLVWDPEAGFQDLRDDICEALNGVPTGGMNSPRFWVADIALTLDRAIVQDYYADSDSDAWIVPFTLDDQNAPTISPSSDWTPVEQGWVESARDFEERSSSLRGRADIRREVNDKTYTAEQRKTFAEATGLDETKVTDDMLAAAGVSTEAADPDPTVQLEADETRRELAETKTAVATLTERLRLQDRKAFVDQILREGRAEPGQRDQIEKMYDASEQAARDYFAAAPVNEALLREFGAADGDEQTEEQAELADKEYAAEYERMYGEKPLGAAA